MASISKVLRARRDSNLASTAGAPTLAPDPGG